MEPMDPPTPIPESFANHTSTKQSPPHQEVVTGFLAEVIKRKIERQKTDITKLNPQFKVMGNRVQCQRILQRERERNALLRPGSPSSPDLITTPPVTSYRDEAPVIVQSFRDSYDKRKMLNKFVVENPVWDQRASSHSPPGREERELPSGNYYMFNNVNNNHNTSSVLNNPNMNHHEAFFDPLRVLQTPYSVRFKHNPSPMNKLFKMKLKKSISKKNAVVNRTITS
jgi:hypothetical protein